MNARLERPDGSTANGSGEPLAGRAPGAPSVAWRRAASVAIPAVLVAAFAVLVAWPPTHALGVRLLSENQIVEVASFAAFGAAALAMGWRALRAFRRSASLLAWGSVLVAAGMLVMAMEEVSWTQWLFGFGTPAVVRDVNLQREFNVHNLPVIQDLNEWFLVAVGAGAFAWSRRRPRGILVVPAELGPAFLMVALLASLEILTLSAPWGGVWDEVITHLVEVAELILALCALAWAWMAGLWPTGREAAGA